MLDPITSAQSQPISHGLDVKERLSNEELRSRRIRALTSEQPHTQITTSSSSSDNDNDIISTVHVSASPVSANINNDIRCYLHVDDFLSLGDNAKGLFLDEDGRCLTPSCRLRPGEHPRKLANAETEIRNSQAEEINRLEEALRGIQDDLNEIRATASNNIRRSSLESMLSSIATLLIAFQASQLTASSSPAASINTLRNGALGLASLVQTLVSYIRSPLIPATTASNLNDIVANSFVALAAILARAASSSSSASGANTPPSL